MGLGTPCSLWHPLAHLPQCVVPEAHAVARRPGCQATPVASSGPAAQAQGPRLGGAVSGDKDTLQGYCEEQRQLSFVHSKKRKGREKMIVRSELNIACL